MSIATALTALAAAKTAIAAAITAKGGTVNSGDGMSDFAADIGTIQTGMANLVNSVTWTGTYANYLNDRAYSVGCNSSGEILIVLQGYEVTNYENIYFSLESAPVGVTLKGAYSSAFGSNFAGMMFGCVLQGVTSPVDLTFACDVIDGTTDYVWVRITAAQA